MTSQELKFYVYEHWRPDTNVCFWVGKGHGNRARNFKRNKEYNAVVEGLSKLGMQPVVKFIILDVCEQAAFDAEIERIAYWRSVCSDLTNKAAGGEGPVGARHSAEAKEKIKAKRALQVIRHSEETRKKIGASNSVALLGKKNPEHSTRMKGRLLSVQHIEKIAAKNRGSKRSKITCENISRSLKGRIVSAQAKENMRLAQLGRKVPEEIKQKMSAAQKLRWARQRSKGD